MKKVFMFLAVIGVMAFSAQNAAAQDAPAADTTATEVAAPEAAGDELPEEVPMHQALKTKFIEGWIYSRKERVSDLVRCAV